MRALSLNSLRGWSLEDWAFGLLLATIGAVVFSIALGQAFAGVTFLVFLIAVRRGTITFRMPAVVWFAVAFGMVAVATSFKQDGLHGLWGRTGKLLWFALIPVTASLACQPGRPRLVIHAFLCGAGILALKDLVRNPWRAWVDPTPDFLSALIDQGSMTDGQMLMLGMVAAGALMACVLKDGRLLSGWMMALLAFLGAGLLIGFKRGSWFCALFLIGTVLASHLRWRACLLVVLVVATVVLLPPVQVRMGQLDREWNRNGGGRLTMWSRVVPRLIRERPEGVGYGCLTNRMMRYACRWVEPNRNHLHANWAQVLVETGWLGLGIYLLWMGRALVDAVRWVRGSRAGPAAERAAALATAFMLAGLLLNGIVEYNFGDTELIFVYAVLMGLAAQCGGDFAAARLRAKNS